MKQHAESTVLLETKPDNTEDKQVPQSDNKQPICLLDREKITALPQTFSPWR